MSPLSGLVERLRLDATYPVAIISSILTLAALFAANTFQGEVASRSDDAWQQVIDKVSEDYQAVPMISIDELRVQGDGSVVLIDVRSFAEQTVSKIPGAVAVEELQWDTIDREKTTLVAYCTVGIRSSEWAMKQRRQGFDARNLRGGITAWCRDGRPLENSAGRTNQVHVYSPSWNFIPPGYEAKW